MPASDEPLSRVRKILVDALGVEEDEVKPPATLLGDLGAESIDLLDITFRLEREFGIRIPKDELFPDDPSPDGPSLTRDLSSVPEHGPRSGRIDDPFTVDLLAAYVEWKLGRGVPGRAGSLAPFRSPSIAP